MTGKTEATLKRSMENLKEGEVLIVFRSGGDHLTITRNERRYTPLNFEPDDRRYTKPPNIIGAIFKILLTLAACTLGLLWFY
jgi:hypothetical protein